MNARLRQLRLSHLSLSQAVFSIGFLSLGASLLAYSISWRQWPKLISDRHLFTEGGRKPHGTLQSIRARGFGQERDYYLRVAATDSGQNFEQDLLVAASVLNPVYGPDKAPFQDLGSELHAGDQVEVEALNSSEPLVVSLSVVKGGTKTELIEFNRSRGRILATAGHAEEISSRARLLALLMVAAAVGANLAIVRLRKIKSP
jgi:hypothetical protein